MKKRILSFVCALLLAVTLPGLLPTAEAAVDASAYFGSTSVRSYAEGDGEILIEIDVTATHKMLEVGASEVYIYEQQSDGDYEVVYTFTKEDYPTLIIKNSSFANLDVYYPGTSGTKYFALVGCYARDEDGSETRYYDTYIITA